MFLFSVFYVVAFGLIAAMLFLFFWSLKLREKLRVARLELERCQLTLEISEVVGRFGSWHLDAKTNVVKWSDYIFDMHGRRHSFGHPMLEKAIDYYHPDDRSMVKSFVQRALDEAEDFEFSARIITEQGIQLEVLARGTCQISGDGNVLGLFGCFIELDAMKDRNS